MADIIGDDGFTIALLLVKEPTEDGDELVDVVATGSVKNFGAGDVETYAEWSKNVSGTQWAAESNERRSNAEVNVTSQQATDNGQENVRLEITAFAVSPSHQGLGLGARVISDIEWLVSRFAPAADLRITEKPGLIRIANPPAFKGATLLSTTSHQACPIIGIDVDILKQSLEEGSQTSPTVKEETSGAGVYGKKLPKLVLMGIRELGKEDYYKRRGYKSVWAGVVPVGMWDCLEECTMVYMEKELPVLDVRRQYIIQGNTSWA
jgi:GNAT superfamily N-acetyltransferase